MLSFILPLLQREGHEQEVDHVRKAFCVLVVSHIVTWSLNPAKYEVQNASGTEENH